MSQDTPDDKRPRDFWLEPQGMEYIEDDPPNDLKDRFIHVIEYSAYERLEAENARLREQLNPGQNWVYASGARNHGKVEQMVVGWAKRIVDLGLKHVSIEVHSKETYEGRDRIAKLEAALRAAKVELTNLVGASDKSWDTDMDRAVKFLSAIYQALGTADKETE